MRLADLPLDDLRFRTCDEAEPLLRAACDANPDLASFEEIGRSEAGRPIHGVTLGYGPRIATLIAGAHADEPVGPETLRTLILETLAHRDWLAEDEGFERLFERFTLRIVPHVNPDGEAANRAWIERWPDLPAFLKHRVREAPGRDLEFGFPVMRAENRAATAFLFDGEPLTFHASLHGMAFSEGALLLLERHAAENRETERLGALKHGWTEATRAAGLALHDHDRGGDKGFRYYGPGFWSTPEGAAMQAHFRAAGDEATAALFHRSSMEQAMVSSLDAGGSRPLCLVTELPLWLVRRREPHTPGRPAAYLALKDALPEAEALARTGGDPIEALAPFGLTPLPLETAVRLQLAALDLGLDAAG